MGVPEFIGDNVYCPIIDFFIGASRTCTPLESQFTYAETFSLEELSLSLVRVPPTESPPAVDVGVLRRRRAWDAARARARGW